jgi:hypothetical protein
LIWTPVVLTSELAVVVTPVCDTFNWDPVTKASVFISSVTLFIKILTCDPITSTGVNNSITTEFCETLTCVPVKDTITSSSSPQGTIPQPLIPQPASGWISTVSFPTIKLICVPVTSTEASAVVVTESISKFIWEPVTLTFALAETITPAQARKEGEILPKLDKKAYEKPNDMHNNVFLNKR